MEANLEGVPDELHIAFLIIHIRGVLGPLLSIDLFS